jgi:hypothetical protein
VVTEAAKSGMAVLSRALLANVSETPTPTSPLVPVRNLWIAAAPGAGFPLPPRSAVRTPIHGALRGGLALVSVFSIPMWCFRTSGWIRWSLDRVGGIHLRVRRDPRSGHRLRGGTSLATARVDRPANRVRRASKERRARASVR